MLDIYHERKKKKADNNLYTYYIDNRERTLTATASSFLTKRADCCCVTCSVGNMVDHCIYTVYVATCPLLTQSYTAPTDRIGLLSLLLHRGHDGFSVPLLIVVFRLVFSLLFSSSIVFTAANFPRILRRAGRSVYVRIYGL